MNDYKTVRYIRFSAVTNELPDSFRNKKIHMKAINDSYKIQTSQTSCIDHEYKNGFQNPA